MNILLIGSGGREHALAWKISQSSHCDQLFITPGNAGTALCGTNLPLSGTDFPALQQACLDLQIQMVVVGPEEPLVKGIADFFANTPELRHIMLIGPSAFGAQLEGSKAFAKAFMERHQIPTAAYREFTSHNFEDGLKYIAQHPLPVVLKADGLAAGKGVLICTSTEEALKEFEEMIQNAKFGDASSKVVVEAFLDGIEMSVFALTDGKDYVLLPEAKDYKRIGEGDTGLNTGGMGAVSPVPFADAAFFQKVINKVVEPTIRGLHEENIAYVGFVFFGLIKVGNEPMVIEYNCRMGDPETEVVMPRLKTDLVLLLQAAAQKKLNGCTVETDPRTAVTTVAVSGGYPGAYQKGLVIDGLDQPWSTDTLCFHAGTTQRDGAVVTAGGRVLALTAFGSSVKEAAALSRKTLSNISFEGMYFRKDIGHEF